MRALFARPPAELRAVRSLSRCVQCASRAASSSRSRSAGERQRKRKRIFRKRKAGFCRTERRRQRELHFLSQHRPRRISLRREQVGRRHVLEGTGYDREGTRPWQMRGPELPLATRRRPERKDWSRVRGPGYRRSRPSSSSTVPRGCVIGDVRRRVGRPEQLARLHARRGSDRLRALPRRMRQEP